MKPHREIKPGDLVWLRNSRMESGGLATVSRLLSEPDNFEYIWEVLKPDHNDQPSLRRWSEAFMRPAAEGEWQSGEP